MHILDIIQNSISAGATRVTLTVDENPAADLLTIVIGDNGRGMTPEQVSRLSDPFFTNLGTRAGNGGDSGFRLFRYRSPAARGCR